MHWCRMFRVPPSSCQMEQSQWTPRLQRKTPSSSLIILFTARALVHSVSYVINVSYVECSVAGPKGPVS